MTRGVACWFVSLALAALAMGLVLAGAVHAQAPPPTAWTADDGGLR